MHNFRFKVTGNSLALGTSPNVAFVLYFIGIADVQ